MDGNIKIRQFNEKDLPSVWSLIQNTVDVSYHGVYPTEAIELFKYHHSMEKVLDDAATGYTVVAECDGTILGTGTLSGTNIRRVYISTLHQHRGIGKLIVEELERKASLKRLAILELDASLVSRRFWETLGYVIQREDYVPTRNNQKLRYYKMVKTINESHD